MRSKIRITVIKKLSATELYGDSQPCDWTIEDICPKFEVGDVYIAPEDGSCPAGLAATTPCVRRQELLCSAVRTECGRCSSSLSVLTRRQLYCLLKLWTNGGDTVSILSANRERENREQCYGL